MYGVMRKYKLVGSWNEANRVVSDEFVPVIKAVKSFRAYKTVDLGGGYMASFSLFDDRAAAEEATQKAREWISSSAAAKRTFPEPPEVLGGEIGLNINA